MREKENLFFICHGIDSNLGSEPQVSWRWLKLFSKKIDITVIIESFWYERLVSSIHKEGLTGKIKIISIPMSMNSKKLYHFGLQIKHIIWTFKVAKKINQIVPIKNAKVVYVTLSTTYLPPLAFRKCRSLWWGPIGICETEPLKVINKLPIKLFISEIFRNIFVFSMTNIGFIFCRKAIKHGTILSRTPDYKKILIDGYKADKVHVIPELVDLVAHIPEVAIHEAKNRKNNTIKKIAFVGDIKRAKKNFYGSLILIQKLIKLSGDDVELYIFGSPNASKSIKKVINQCKVTIYPKLERDEYLFELARCHMLVFPSIREGYSSTLMEALQLELSCIAYEVGGNITFRENPRLTLIPKNLKLESNDINILIMNWLDKIKKIGDDKNISVNILNSEFANKIIDNYLQDHRK